MPPHFGMGYLAVRFGEQAMPYLAGHKWETVVVALVGVSYGLSRVLFRGKPREAEDE